MDSKTVRRTGTAMSATADVNSLSTTASTRRMLEPPCTGTSQADLPNDDDAGRSNHWSCTVRYTDDSMRDRASCLWPSQGLYNSTPVTVWSKVMRVWIEVDQLCRRQAKLTPVWEMLRLPKLHRLINAAAADHNREVLSRHSSHQTKRTTK